MAQFIKMPDEEYVPLKLWDRFETETFFQKDFLSFEESRKFARKLDLKSSTEWKEYCKSNKSYNIPYHPYRIYKDKGWTSWGDFLGTGNVHKKDFISFEEAKKFVRHLDLKSSKEWRKYCKSGKRPNNIPAVPERVYKDKGWISWGDFLGTDYISCQNRIYLSFEKTRIFVRKLKLSNVKEWQEYCKSGNKPDNIPSYPNSSYKDKGWISWGDFLGTGYISSRNRNFLPFEEARKFIKSLNLRGEAKWRKYSKSDKRPNNIPANPNIIYKDKGWISWGDFLGTGIIADKNKVFLPFIKARIFVRKLKLSNVKEWQEYSKSRKKPNNIPSHPDRTYKNKWISWYDFLGNKK